MQCGSVNAALFCERTHGLIGDAAEVAAVWSGCSCKRSHRKLWSLIFFRAPSSLLSMATPADNQLNYGDSLEREEGISVDLREVARDYKLSADNGNADGQFHFGRCLEQGKGTCFDFVAAARYYKLSADQGNADGQFHFARCLEAGMGVGIDLVEAARYYKLSADQGSVDAQHRYRRLQNLVPPSPAEGGQNPGFSI
jgi:TPR repeat protein